MSKDSLQTETEAMHTLVRDCQEIALYLPFLTAAVLCCQKNERIKIRRVEKIVK